MKGLTECFILPEMSKNTEITIDYSSLPAGGRLAVACSGGPDSMALTLLTAVWAAKTGTDLVALTVDHGLRTESAAEAQKVSKWLKQKKIQHVILRWEGKKPKANLQEAARRARYELMAEYCRAEGIRDLLVAHTRDDQAETFLLRLARGSGVDGLSCMQPVAELFGLTLHRPLLGTGRTQLLAYLKKQKQSFITDPSNSNEKFDRVKMRKALPELAKLGLTVERLASTASTMTRARAALEEATAKVMAASCAFFPEAYAMLQPFDAPEEIELRVFAALVMVIGGHEVRPRLEDIIRLSDAVRSETFSGATLGGCQFIPKPDGLLICREPSAVAKPVAAGSGEWDGRFNITCNAGKGWTIGALTQAGWLALAKEHNLTSPYPDKRILYTLPALRDARGDIIAAPHLGVGGGMTIIPVPVSLFQSVSACAEEFYTTTPRGCPA